MTDDGRFVEIQGTGEEAAFDDAQLAEMLSLAKSGIRQIFALQDDALRKETP
jgi:ribonuclease PH